MDIVSLVSNHQLPCHLYLEYKVFIINRWFEYQRQWYSQYKHSFHHKKIWQCSGRADWNKHCKWRLQNNKTILCPLIHLFIKPILSNVPQAPRAQSEFLTTKWTSKFINNNLQYFLGPRIFVQNILTLH